jgi:tRNA modification GTPase
MRSDEDTIFALTTAPGRAAVAIIRVSGPGALGVADAFEFKMPPARSAGLRKLINAGKILDQALVLYFKAPGSYTGEDLVELQIHGGRAVYDSVVSVLLTLAGFRYAEPGEFSRRAVLNGRLDLTEAEAVNDLVNAETEAQREFALRQMDGALAGVFDQWTSRLVRVRAHLEAYIDFPDEDLPIAVVDDLTADLTNIGAEVARFLDDDRRGERLRSGMRIAVVGPPNAGKSSFINWLTDREIAIVSPEAGTTRDVIEAHLDLGGYPVTIADTAGQRIGGGAVEKEGIRRAREWASKADLRVLIFDSTSFSRESLEAFERGPADVVLMNKIDLDPRDGADGRDSLGNVQGRFGCSLVSGEGLSEVMAHIAREARARMDVSEGPVVSRARHRAALEACLINVERAREGLIGGVVPEIVAEDLRFACDDLGRITGRVDVEDLLDVVFRDFCIGK